MLEDKEISGRQNVSSNDPKSNPRFRNTCRLRSRRPCLQLGLHKRHFRFYPPPAFRNRLSHAAVSLDNLLSSSCLKSRVFDRNARWVEHSGGTGSSLTARSISGVFGAWASEGSTVQAVQERLSCRVILCGRRRFLRSAESTLRLHPVSAKYWPRGSVKQPEMRTSLPAGCT